MRQHLQRRDAIGDAVAFVMVKTTLA